MPLQKIDLSRRRKIYQIYLVTQQFLGILVDLDIMERDQEAGYPHSSRVEAATLAPSGRKS